MIQNAQVVLSTSSPSFWRIRKFLSDALIVSLSRLVLRLYLCWTLSLGCLYAGLYLNILTVQSVGACFGLFDFLEHVRTTAYCHSAEADGLTPMQLMLSLRKYGWRLQRVYNFFRCLQCFLCISFDLFSPYL